MQNSVGKIAAWVWILLYVTLTSFSSNQHFSALQSTKIETQNKTYFEANFNATNHAIQPQLVEQVAAPFCINQLKVNWHFNGINSLPIAQAIEFNRINYFVDFQAIEYSFSGLDHIFPFHYFW